MTAPKVTIKGHILPGEFQNVIQAIQAPLLALFWRPPLRMLKPFVVAKNIQPVMREGKTGQIH